MTCVVGATPTASSRPATIGPTSSSGPAWTISTPTIGGTSPCGAWVSSSTMLHVARGQPGSHSCQAARKLEAALQGNS